MLGWISSCLLLAPLRLHISTHFGQDASLVQPPPSHLPACARYQSLSGLGGTSARIPVKALGWDSLWSTLLAEHLLRATGKALGCSMQQDRPGAMLHVIGKAGLGVRPGQGWLGHRMPCLPAIGSLSLNPQNQLPTVVRAQGR